jgi:hypothetical protein
MVRRDALSDGDALTCRASYAILILDFAVPIRREYGKLTAAPRPEILFRISYEMSVHASYLRKANFRIACAWRIGKGEPVLPISALRKWAESHF